jgi:hypothetical protein
MTRHLKFAALLCAAALSACGDDANQLLATSAPAAAQVKFFNFGVGSPGVNFYANTTKMTAIGSATGTESTTGTTYGNAGASGLYTTIAPGQYDLAGKIAAATDKDLAISHVAATLESGKYYSFYQSGFYNTTTKSVDSFLIEDKLPPVPTDTSITYVRFVNAISNSTPLTLWVKNTVTGDSTAIGGATAYKSATDFVSLPGAFYDMTARDANGAAKIVRTGVSLNSRGVFTITARGDFTITSTTATNRPQLDNTFNR